MNTIRPQTKTERSISVRCSSATTLPGSLRDRRGVRKDSPALTVATLRYSRIVSIFDGSDTRIRAWVGPPGSPCPLSASITPRELTGLLFDEKDIAASADNGLGNRFLYTFVARDKLVAHPAPTENRDALTRTIAENVRKVYAELKPARGFLSTPIEFTPEARDLYERAIYKRVDGLQAASSVASRRVLPISRLIISAIASARSSSLSESSRSARDRGGGS